MYYLITFIIIISLFIIIGIYEWEKRNRDRLAQSRVNELLQQREKIKGKLEQDLHDICLEIQNQKNRLIELKEEYNNYEKETKERIDNYTESYKEKAIKLAKAEIREAQKQEEEEIRKKTCIEIERLTSECLSAQETLNLLQSEIEITEQKQNAINEEIRRRREIEEKNDFYRVCLSEEAIADIKILTEIRKNLKKPEIIDKIIYDNYVGKPVLEMIKRVLQNTNYSGIYKITCIPTGEIYIGKSTDVKNRWQQHCKTAFNCGTIASSLLHTKMKQYGIENFTFELLEKVPKDQLTEREKFYINFYKTKEVGLNERNG